MTSALLGLLLAAAVCPNGVSFPRQEWVSAPSANAEAIKALEEYAFTLTGTDTERLGIRTDGVVIIHKGKLIYEKYGRGWTEKKRHLSWSVTKTFVNALTGIASLRGALSIDDGICDRLKLQSTEACEKLKVRHLLEFSSGLDFKEVYENESNQASSVLAMLYGEGHKDMANFVASHKFRDAPGTTYAYSSGDSTLLNAVVDAAMIPKFGADYAWKLLFNPLGMASVVVERDQKGTLIGSSYLYATPRDLARFGYLWQHDGCWNGVRLLPDGWVEQSKQISAGFKAKPLYRDPNEVYAWQWTVNKAVPEVGQDALPLADIPGDAFAARGHWGQSISVIPSLELVVVRVADDRQKSFELNEFLKRAIEVSK
jgi:CubicO group peptidase (beta-lactamase class C family)